MAELERVSHTFAPVYDEHSKVLILGTFPSVKSREMLFYYGHPQNRFWKIIAALTGETLPDRMDIEGKKEMLLKHGIAVWDVIESCSIAGSSDSSIKDVIPNDISRVLEHSDIKKIYANGAKAYDLYQKYIKDPKKLPIEKLPSTSPANAAWNMEKLLEAWKVILE